MSWRSTAFRVLAIAGVASLAPGCGGTSGATRTDELPSEGPLKISYFRTNPEPKTKRPEPTFKVLMSNSWRDLFGESPRDPLTRAAPGKIFKGSDADIVVARYIRDLKSRGLDQLESDNADNANPVTVYQKATSPLDRDHPRIITIGTDKSARSYSFHSQKTEEQSRTFIACEKLVSAIMDGHVMLVTIDKNPPGAAPNK
jgi:hypothetical protein